MSTQRRRSSAAVAYGPPQGYAPSQNSNYDPDAYSDNAPPGAIPYGPPEPAIVPQPGMRRGSSYQPQSTPPMAVPAPRHPGYQSTSSYGPSNTGPYGTSPSYQQAPPGPPPTAQYGASPNGGQYYGTSPNSYPQPVQQYANAPPIAAPQPGYAQPPRSSYTHRLDSDDAIAFDDSADYHPSHDRDRRHSHSRTYSHSSPSRPDARRLSAQDAYDDRYSDAYRVPADERRERRGSRGRYDDTDDATSEYDEGYEAGLRAAERRERRESKTSVHSKSSRGSRQHSKTSKDDPRTYGDSVDWAWKGMKKFLGSGREV